jgi:hypothetical protein
MQALVDAFTLLGSGALYSFRDWPNPAVPKHGAGVYTIWNQDRQFIYVGMSGRAITKDTTVRNTPYGIYTRLRSHASGRRSGDQFCVYVADRLVLPTLSQPEIASIASGEHQMDAFVRRFIHEHLSYRFVVVPDRSAPPGCDLIHVGRTTEARRQGGDHTRRDESHRGDQEASRVRRACSEPFAGQAPPRDVVPHHAGCGRALSRITAAEAGR